MKQMDTVYGRHYRTGAPLQITIQGGLIASIRELDQLEQLEQLELPKQSRQALSNWIAPGFVDLQINGHAGLDFNRAGLTEADVHAVTELLVRQGITSYLPTVITNEDGLVASILTKLAAACAANARTAGSIPGIHLEGPFICPEDGARGAHDRRYVKKPDWDLFQAFQEAAQGRIRIVTLSPEWDNAPAFIAKCREHNVIVSIGHTAATPEQIRSAISAGATMSTHLGNGSHFMLPRHANFLWEQLAADELWACIIADGFHLPASLLKVFSRAKRDRLIVVSDALYVSGMPPGTYDTEIGTQVTLTPEGKLHVAGNPALLAGSAQLPLHGVEHLWRSGILSLSEAWDAASIRPARALGLPAAQGLAPGAPADFVVYAYDSSFTADNTAADTTAGTDNTTAGTDNTTAGKLQIQAVYKQGIRL